MVIELAESPTRMPVIWDWPPLSVQSFAPLPKLFPLSCTHTGSGPGNSLSTLLAKNVTCACAMLELAANAPRKIDTEPASGTFRNLRMTFTRNGACTLGTLPKLQAPGGPSSTRYGKFSVSAPEVVMLQHGLATAVESGYAASSTICIVMRHVRNSPPIATSAIASSNDCSVGDQY